MKNGGSKAKYRKIYFFFFPPLLSTTYETEETDSFENLSLLFRILYSLVIFKCDLFI